MLAVALAAPALAACEGDTFRAIERPIDPEHPEAGTFPWVVRVEPGARPDAVPVVFLPGGPGFEVLEAGRAYGVVPAELPLVTTQLRGVGCNALPEPVAPASSWTTTHADDVLAAIEALGLDTFALYGHSYGSVLATVVAHRAEARGMHVTAVILEGTVGRTWSQGDRQFDGFVARWEHLLADPAAARLRKRVGRLGFAPEVWGEWVYGTLAAGAGDGGPDPVLAVGSGPKKALREALAAAAEGAGIGPESLSPGEAWATRETLCRELLEESFWHARVGPDLRLEPLADGCADVAVDRPYDPADWPIRAPIVYLAGDADPVTPWARARAQHLEAMPESPRAAVRIPGAGHFAARQLGDCAAPVFRAAVEGRAPDPAACTRPLAVEVVPGLLRAGHPQSGPSLP